MDATRKMEPESLIREALRAQIGEPNYSRWFAQGVRFALSGGVAYVLPENNFYYDWIQSGNLVPILTQIVRKLFGPETSVKVELRANAQTARSSGAPAVPYAERATFLPFPTGAPELSRSESTLAQTLEAPREPRPTNASPADVVPPYNAPKRRRGRPRKNPVPAQTSAQTFAATPRFPQTQPALFDGAPIIAQAAQAASVAPRANPDGDLPPAFAAPTFGAPAFSDPFATREATPAASSARLEPAAQPFFDGFAASPYMTPAAPALHDAPAAPVKRKRGRPRKNPLPAAPTEFAQPSAPQPVAARRADSSFYGARPSSYVAAPSGASPRPDRTSIVTPGGLAAAFAAASRDAVAESVAADAERLLAHGAVAQEPFARGYAPAELAPTAPRKRGRPKGTASAPTSYAASDDGEVLRDANGFNIVRLPKEHRRAKSEGAANRRYATLETFLPGLSNRAACRAIGYAMESPGVLNPIVLWGSTSVGKTHLLEGVCEWKFRSRQYVKPPLYMTSEEFTTLFIQSFRGGASFRERFRDISLLALDDLQFFEGKTATQTELLNVYNYLRDRNVQMIFSANCKLSDLNLRGELVTRLQSGVSAEIAQPERELLARLLLQMAQTRNLIVPDDVCRYVVSHFALHARQISGAVNSLYVAHMTTGAPITMELAHDALAGMEQVASPAVKLEDVERVVLQEFGLESNALKSSSRAKRCADPRALAMWLARKKTRAALAEIGSYFGGRRHSAVICAEKKVDNWIAEHAAIEAADGAYPVEDTLRKLERALESTRA